MNNQSGSSAGSIVVVVVCLVLGLSFFAVLAVGTLLWFTWQSAPQPVYDVYADPMAMQEPVEETAMARAIGRTFFETIDARQYDGAYEMTTTNFQQEWSRGDFEKLVGDHPVASGPFENVHFGATHEADSPTLYDYRLTVRHDDGTSTTVTLKMISEDGIIKVDQWLEPEVSGVEQDSN